MRHDEARRLLAPLAREFAPPTRDVTAGVMADVRRAAPRAPADPDLRVWRLAATIGAAAAVVAVGVSLTVSMPSDDSVIDSLSPIVGPLEVP